MIEAREIAIKKTIKSQQDKKRDARQVFYGLLGDGQGVVRGRKPGHVKVRLPELRNVDIEVWNSRVPIADGLPVTVGYTDENPDLLQVLGINLTPSIVDGEGAEEASAIGLLHHHTHEWRGELGGNDVVIVQLRQFAPLRPTITGGFGFVVERGLCPTDTSWVAIERTYFDLGSDHPELIENIPTGRGYYLLVFVNRDGEIELKQGRIKPIEILSYRDIPFPPPFGGYAICALRLYAGQTALVDSETQTDLVDLRFPQPNRYNSLIKLIAGMGRGIWANLAKHVFGG